MSCTAIGYVSFGCLNESRDFEEKKCDPQFSSSCAGQHLVYAWGKEALLGPALWLLLQGQEPLPDVTARVTQKIVTLHCQSELFAKIVLVSKIDSKMRPRS